MSPVEQNCTTLNIVAIKLMAYGFQSVPTDKAVQVHDQPNLRMSCVTSVSGLSIVVTVGISKWYQERGS
jgi:hypothetical protein